MKPYKIDRNVPIPERWNHRYPIEKMEVGDSFMVECDPVRAEIVRPAIHTKAARHGVKCTTRKCEGGIRVWRVK